MGRRDYFSCITYGRLVVKALKRQESEQVATTLTYVVMPDHMHWLMQLHRTGDLSTCVGNTKSYSARLIAGCRNCRGGIWQRGFFDHAVRREQDLAAVARYIVANPLRAGLVEKIGDYALWDSVWMN